MTLRIYGQEPKTIFGLAGLDENSATFALGWALEKCLTFRELLIKIFLNEPIKRQDSWLIDLQQHGHDKGFTDVEIRNPGHCHIIIEAKRDWTLPSSQQLSRYRQRFSKHGDKRELLVSISAASEDYGKRNLPSNIVGIPLAHYSWTSIRGVALKAYERTTSKAEKQLLRDLSMHLQEYAVMQNPKDNMVYVVSLSSRSITDKSPYTWIDVVGKDGRYFHPIASTWPVVPPNYLGFRYYGRLQSVHHVDSYEVVANLSSVNRFWPTTSDHDHYVYRLGPAMLPATEIRNGKIYPMGRYWCAIDTLLSGAFKTVSDARDETNRRLQ